LTWPIVTTVIGVLALVVAIPTSYKKAWTPSFLDPEIRLGLDLAGGTQLNFRISEDEINRRINDLEASVEALKDAGASSEDIAKKQVDLASTQQQKEHLVEAIRTVLERRINGLGVSEATVTPSFFGNEKHLLVDCPGVIDPTKCADTVGKTIQLEFKEEFTDATEEYKNGIRQKADKAFAAIQSGSGTLKTIGEDMSTQLGIAYKDAQPYFQDELPEGLKDFWTRAPNSPAVERTATMKTIRNNSSGNAELVDVQGIYIAEVEKGPTPAQRSITSPALGLEELAKTIPGTAHDKRNDANVDTLSPALNAKIKSMKLGDVDTYEDGGKASIVYVSGRIDGEEEATLSHILVQFTGAEQADASVKRTKDEAKTRAESLLKRVQAGENFASIARKESDGPSRSKGGVIGKVKRGTFGGDFDAVAFALKKGQTSGVVESPFGFHIVRADSDVLAKPSTVSFSLLTFSGPDAATVAKANLERLKKGITRTEDQITVRSLFFSLEPTGWKDTQLNGQHFRSASVTTDNISGVPVVQILFDDEGGKLFQELTKNNVGKRIAIFVGGELVSAPTVQQEISGGSAVITGSRTFEEANALAQDLNTGAIPAPIYLSGQSTIQATLGINALHASIIAAIVGFIILCIFMVVVYRLLGVIASFALAFYCILLIAMMKLPVLLITNQHIVLTLAGIAGIILSIGMAVDANVLIFERMKEEMKKGKSLRTAAQTGFKRAWPSIRDGNATTLITSMILFIIGTSIIRGFAITLSLGIILSLFTAIVVTRWILNYLMGSPITQRNEFFPGASARNSLDQQE
jgi:protein-export membrane protein SecD